ncbi:enoyl-CoA hydratase [Rhodococcus sp. KBW08]|uniref:MaoC family dehydratase n=1 Tax=Rhodococcus sp. KBW08 TaxID=2144188 RepID=UPI000F591C60|nr:MaoC family dehydratase [Rhodococcus sp. KBW08]RQO46053.1 enoyl-CoA hydratase [Rhodococcus sp. KBW08]
MRIFTSVEELRAAGSKELGVSDWKLITQNMVDLFAEATGDHQWIHTDINRARRESPFGGPIAHGYLSLSLLPALAAEIFTIDGAKHVVNYGSNKVRYVNPLPVGARVRLRSSFISISEVRDGGLQVVIAQQLEVEGVEKPVLVAETVSRIVF